MTRLEKAALTVTSEARLQWRENKAGLFLVAVFIVWIIGLLMGGD